MAIRVKGRPIHVIVEDWAVPLMTEDPIPATRMLMDAEKLSAFIRLYLPTGTQQELYRRLKLIYEVIR